MIVTLNNVTESKGSKFTIPNDGNVFLLANFTIENNSNKDISISSIMSFDAYVDGYSTSLSFSALLHKGEEQQLDGTIAPGKKLKGVVGYEVPSDYKEFEIYVQTEIFSSKKIEFIYSK